MGLVIAFLGVFGAVAWRVLHLIDNSRSVSAYKSLSLWLPDYESQDKPVRPERVVEFMAGLSKGESSLDKSRQGVWDALPNGYKGRLRVLEPKDYTLDRARACWDLAGCGPSASNAVTALMRVANEDPSLDVRTEAMKALGAIGPAARPAIPQLLGLFTNGGNGPLCYAPGWALAQIAPENETVARTLIDSLARTSPSGGQKAISVLDFEQPIDALGASDKLVLIRALGKMNPQTQEILAALYGQLEHGDYAARATAAEALGGTNPAQQETVLRLAEALLRSKDEVLPDGPVPVERFRVRPTDPPWHHHLPQARIADYLDIAKKLESVYLPDQGLGGWGLRLRIIWALSRIGPAARDAIPTLVREYENQTNILRFDAAAACWHINGPSSGEVAIFVSGLQDSDVEIRKLALARLSELASEFVEAIPLLTKALDDRDLLVRWWAVLSMQSLGPKAVSAMPQLKSLENDPSYRVRFAATQAVQVVQGMARHQ